MYRLLPLYPLLRFFEPVRFAYIMVENQLRYTENRWLGTGKNCIKADNQAQIVFSMSFSIGDELETD